MSAPKLEVLVCDCKECDHWKVVRMSDGSIHLHCKTCETLVEVDSFTAYQSPARNIRWIPADSE